MAKEPVYICVALATDGKMTTPQLVNVINLSAVGPGSLTFSQNISPQRGTYLASKWWEEHPEEFEKLKRSTISLPRAMTAWGKYLGKFQGRLILVASSLDYWLLQEMYNYVGEACPFRHSFIDINTLKMIMMNHVTPEKYLTGVEPHRRVEEIYDIVMNQAYLGRHMATFGQRRPSAKKASPPPTPPARQEATTTTTALPPLDTGFYERFRARQQQEIQTAYGNRIGRI